MTLLQKTDVFQGSKEKAARKHSGYGFVLALICVALAFVAAKYSKYSRHSADVGGLAMTTKELGHPLGWPKFEENDRIPLPQRRGSLIPTTDGKLAH